MIDSDVQLGLIGLAIVIVNGTFNYLSKRSTDAKLADISKTAIDTHTLVNSQHGQTLRALAVSLRANAVLTGTEIAKSEAEEAERNYKDHILKQDVVDSGIKTK